MSKMADARLYIFTGSRDDVVYFDVVAQIRQFYEMLGVKGENIAYHDSVPAGHSIITNNPEDSALATNQPPYINNGGFMQSQDILEYIYGGLKPAAERLAGRLLRFDQTEFLGKDAQWTSMSRFGYAYIPSKVLAGAVAEPRVHIAGDTGARMRSRFTIPVMPSR